MSTASKKDWRGRYYRVTCPAGFDGHPKRRAVYCETKNAASNLKARIKHWKLERRMPSLQRIVVSEDDMRRIVSLKAEIGDLSLLPRIIDHWKRTSEEAVQKTTVANAVERFLDWRSQQGEWTLATAGDTTSRLNIFKTAFGWRDIHTLTTGDLERWLAMRGKSYGKYLAKLRPLFRWAQRQRHLAINPMDGIEPPTSEYREVQVYSPDELLAMLTEGERSFRDMVPFIACSAFGFLRTEELIPRYAGEPVLEWSAFEWAEKQILVPHRVAKKARSDAGNDRSIPINDALAHWLEPYIQKSGQLVQRDKAASLRVLAKIRKQAGTRSIPNGLRHSCISYWLAANGEESFGTVARWSGNSAAIIRRHYLQVLKRSQGQRWLAVRRDALK